jgi:SpoVK/Ycf46/Vps4 family AAA+-type ATPase
MAKSDLIKRLFRSFKTRDEKEFMRSAFEIIEDERKKHHIVLANELDSIINSGSFHSAVETYHGFEQIPRDSDKDFPLLTIKRPDRYISDIILDESAKGILLDVVEQYRNWEVLEANMLKPSNKLLFCGPPGCGKTATAEALANEAGLPLLNVRFDSVVSSLLGETASNLRQVFDYASRGNWLLLFDEFDTIGRSREDITEHGELKRVVNTFLQMLDQFEGRSLIVAATNFEASLDPALWRRFDEVLRFEKPTSEQILYLLKKNFSHLKRSDLHFPDLLYTLEGMSHAEIERICKDALKTAILKGKLVLTNKDFQNSVHRQESRKQALQVQKENPPHID